MSFLHFEMEVRPLLQVFRGSAYGNQNADLFGRKSCLNGFDCRDEVGVARDYDGLVKPIFDCHLKHMKRYVYVRLLFLKRPELFMAQEALLLLAFEFPVNNPDAFTFLRFYEELMPCHLSRVPSGQRCEIQNLLDNVAARQVGTSKLR